MREVQTYLGSFGKHPGWNDHIDDLGLDTPALTALKRSLYFDGVAANIDRGEWEQLDEESRLPGFGHEFILRDHGSWFAGRMWQSRDGKNRRRYPMVIVLQALDTPLLWVLEEGLPRLERLADKCKKTESAGEVMQDVDNTRRRLRGSQSNDAERGTVMPDWLEAQRPFFDLAKHEELGEGREGWYRFQYELARKCGPWLAGAKPDKQAPPAHLRVPACYGNRRRSFLTWFGVFEKALAPDAPVMLVRPLDLSYMDVLVGPAGPKQYYCLLANLSKIPAVTTVPFTGIDQSFKEHVDEQLVVWDRLEQPLLVPALSNGQARIREKNGLFGRLFG